MNSPPPAPLHPQRNPLLLPLAGALLACLILLPSLFYPFSGDQSVFAYLGREWANGATLYRDVWDIKPPAVFLIYGLLYQLSDALSPHNTAVWMSSVRVLDVALATLTASLLALLTRRWVSATAGLAAAGWYAALYMHRTYWGMSQTEAWANPFVIAAILLCITIDDRRARPRAESLLLLLTGLCTGMAASLKFTALLPVVPAVVWLCWRAWAAQDRNNTAPLKLCLQRLVLIGAGTALPLALSLWWLHANGAWEAYREIQVGFVKPYAQFNVGDSGLRIASILVFTVMWLWGMGVPAALAIVGWFQRSQWQRHGRVLAVASLLCALLAVWVQGKFFRYHWISAMPFIAIAAATGAAWLFSYSQASRRVIIALNAGIVLLWSGFMFRDDYRDSLLHVTGRLPERQWLERFGFKDGTGPSFLSSAALATYITQHTAPTDTIQVWGPETLAYILSERRAATRFFFTIPVNARFSPPQWREEFFTSLKRNKPRLIVVEHKDRSLPTTGLEDDSAALLKKWPQLEKWVHAHYRKTRTMGNYDIYLRL